MGTYKLGYPTGLDAAASYTAGKALYDKFSAAAITLDSTKMCRAVGQVNGSPTTTLTANGIINYPNVANTTFAAASAAAAFEVDEFNSGFVRFLSGACKDSVYKITDTTASTLVSGTNFGTAGVVNDDYFEVVTGGCTYEFPSGRNPIRRDFKKVYKSESHRFPFYESGLSVPLGWEGDDLVLMTYLTDERDYDRLQVFFAHKLDYKGMDAMFSTGGVGGDNSEGIAPLILETGSNDIQNQYLGSLEDFKIVKDAKRSDGFYDVMIHLVNYWQSTYRGL